jgi:alkylation response protein AidB-like acyl-CoA dehydrogenase
MGQRGPRDWSTHCEVRYTGGSCPDATICSASRRGFRIAQKRLGPGRIHHVMRWLGQMQRAFELMCAYALEREVGGARSPRSRRCRNWIADSRRRDPGLPSAHARLLRGS